MTSFTLFTVIGSGCSIFLFLCCESLSLYQLRKDQMWGNGSVGRIPYFLHRIIPWISIGLLSGALSPFLEDHLTFYIAYWTLTFGFMIVCLFAALMICHYLMDIVRKVNRVFKPGRLKPIAIINSLILFLLYCAAVVLTVLFDWGWPSTNLILVYTVDLLVVLVVIWVCHCRLIRILRFHPKHRKIADYSAVVTQFRISISFASLIILFFVTVFTYRAYYLVFDPTNYDFMTGYSWDSLVFLGVQASIPIYFIWYGWVSDANFKLHSKMFQDNWSNSSRGIDRHSSRVSLSHHGSQHQPRARSESPLGSPRERTESGGSVEGPDSSPPENKKNVPLSCESKEIELASSPTSDKVPSFPSSGSPPSHFFGSPQLPTTSVASEALNKSGQNRAGHKKQNLSNIAENPFESEESRIRGLTVGAFADAPRQSEPSDPTRILTPLPLHIGGSISIAADASMRSSENPLQEFGVGVGSTVVHRDNMRHSYFRDEVEFKGIQKPSHLSDSRKKFLQASIRETGTIIAEEAKDPKDHIATSGSFQKLLEKRKQQQPQHVGPPSPPPFSFADPVFDPNLTESKGTESRSREGSASGGVHGPKSHRRLTSSGRNGTNLFNPFNTNPLLYENVQ